MCAINALLYYKPQVCNSSITHVMAIVLCSLYPLSSLNILFGFLEI